MVFCFVYSYINFCKSLVWEYTVRMFLENTKSRFATFLEYTMYGFFALFPFFIFKSFLYQGSSSRFLLLSIVTAVLAICFGIHLLYQKNKVAFLKSPILLAFGIYLVFLFVSAFLGADFGASFWSRVERTSGIFYLTHVAVFALLLIHVVSIKESRDKLMKVVLITSAIYSFCSLIGPQGFDIAFRSNPYDGFMFGNSSFAAMYLLGAFLLSLYFLFAKVAKERSWYMYVLPVVIAVNPFLIHTNGKIQGIADIVGIAKASSIGFFITIVMLGAVWVITRIKNVKTRNIFGVAFFITALLALVFIAQSLIREDGLIRGFYEQQSTLARPVVWELSKQAIKERPLTGWGGDNLIVAYQENFDIKILEAKYGNEAWFDRAHNVLLDQTVEGGYVGIIVYLALYLVLFLALLYSVLKAKEREDIVLGIVLFVYFFIHLLELQTAFDTTVSFVMLALMLALSVYLFNKIQKENGVHTVVAVGVIGKYILAIVLVGYFLWSLLFGSLPFWKIQQVNWDIRKVGSAEKRIPLYKDLFKAKVDLAGVLWRTSTDFQRGIGDKPSILENPKTAKFLLEEAQTLTKAYEEYVATHPDNLRMHLNLADMYIYQRLFDVNKLVEADKVLDEAVKISDKHPQPYWMKAVIALYQRDFKKAREYVAIAKKMDPDAVETKRLEAYIEESIKTFPEIFLYSFIQI